MPRTAATGLSSVEAARRRPAQAKAAGERNSRPVTEILRANILTRFNFILGTLLTVVLAVGPLQDAVFGIILVVNALIGIGQELRAKMTLDRLAVLTAPTVRVIRDATPREIKVADLVSGDLVELRPGDRLVADAIVRASAGLQTDESLLTGESEPVDKQRTAATLVTLARSLGVLMLLAIPLTWRRILLVAAMIAGFVLLFSLPAFRSFYALELPHGARWLTLLISALGAAALAGFWLIARSRDLTVDHRGTPPAERESPSR